MSLMLYNSLTRRKEFLERYAPERRIGMYVCGPTVYDESHIGHARSAFAFDGIGCYLESRGYEVAFVRNITDVDDKIIDRARQEGKDLKASVQAVSERYLSLYREQMAKLGMRMPTEEPRATTYIREMQKMIQEILEKGAAYVSGGDVYFDVRKCEGYGQLSNRSLDEMRQGARVEPSENKRDPLDFALWKSAKEGEPVWESPWGLGRPGWHIECSAMSTEIFRKRNIPFVIHGGGLDLIFPHHENEIAQARGAGRPFASFWMHNGLVTVEDQKMSKSLGNFITLRELFERASSEVIRFYFLQTHYRNPLDFSWDKLEEAKEAYGRFLILFGRIEIHEKDAEKRASVRKGLFETLQENEKKGRGDAALLSYEEDFHRVLEDDFNTPEAIAVLFRLLNYANWILDDPNRPREDRMRDFYTVEYFIRKLGKCISLFATDEAVESLSDEEKQLIAKRDAARQRRDFGTADAIRKLLLGKGIVLEDVEDRTIWRRAR